MAAEKQLERLQEGEFEAYAHTALDELAELFLGDEADELKHRLLVNINDRYLTGSVLPTIAYDMSCEAFMLNIEPTSISEYASEQIDEKVDEDVTVADLSKLLVGAGVARAILASKAAVLTRADLESKHRYHEKICQIGYLWEAVATYDDEHETSLLGVLERLGDTTTPQINVVRFAMGASLNYLTDIRSLQTKVPELFQSDLVTVETARETSLVYNLSILEGESAFEIYDGALPTMLWGLSFPMSPAEELTSFFAEPLE